MMYYKISHGSVTLGNNTVLEDINFCVKDNEKIGIVGRNGSGKTTLLKALKIGLFGCFSFGFRNENATYFKDVARMLSNQADSPTFKITIDFEYVENLTKYNYALSRSWEKGKDELRMIERNYDRVVEVAKLQIDLSGEAPKDADEE